MADCSCFGGEYGRRSHHLPLAGRMLSQHELIPQMAGGENSDIPLVVLETTSLPLTDPPMVSVIGLGPMTSDL